MGIRLDWDIETEKSGTYNAQEDPRMRRLRRQRRRRVILLLIAVGAVFVGLGAVLIWRLTAADLAIETVLRNTVEAEVAALRIGDWNAFNAAQRSADPSWEPRQRALFDQYQALKAERDISLTGTVRDVTIDGQRARVVVEEIIEGVPYAQAWFYWRYDDGWMHGPQDIAFWGDTQAYTGRDITVRYFELDELLARDLGVAVEGWVNATCGPILLCGDLPHITLNINPMAAAQPVWNTDLPWTLDIASPFIGRVRYDQPFSGQLRLDVAAAVAQRLVEEASPATEMVQSTRDAFYIRRSLMAWLTARYAQVGTTALLITSLAENYGTAAVGRLLQSLSVDSSADVFTSVTEVSRLEEANLDWRDFLSWRLRLEHDLYNLAGQEAENTFVSLYDPAFLQTAQARYRASAAPPSEAEVVLAPISTAPDGIPQIVAIARFGKDADLREEQVTFRLIDGTWKRAS